MALSKIKTTSIADDAVTSAKIATSGIATLDMADGSVTSLKIADGAISTVDIANNAITPAKLSVGAPTWSSSYILGIGTTPNAGWNSTNPVMTGIQLGSGGAISAWNSGAQSITMFNNVYDTGGGVQKRMAIGYSAKYDLGGGTHAWGVATTGAADSTISSWNNAMIMDVAGTVAIADSALTGSTVSTNAGGVKLYVSSGVNGWPVTSGTTQTSGALRVRGGDNAVVDFGVNSSSGGWIQVTDKANLVPANAYPLRLQPVGGSVVIGSTGTAGATLDVTGGALFRKPTAVADGGASALFRKSDNTGGMWIGPALSGGQYNSYTSSGDAALISGAQYAPMIIGVHDGNAIRMTQNNTFINTGAMGIGTNSVQSGYILDVAGSTRVQGGVMYNGSIYSTYCNAGTWTTIMSFPANYDNVTWGQIKFIMTENGGDAFYIMNFYQVTRHNGSPYGDFYQMSGGLQPNGSLHGASSQASVRMVTASGDNTTKYLQVNANSYGMGLYVYQAWIVGAYSWQ